MHADKKPKSKRSDAVAQSPLPNTALPLQDNRTASVVQQQQVNAMAAKTEASVQQKENDTGLPDTLKSGIEDLSGHSMDDVKVHYNSPKPAQLNAHAYAQGSEIHVAAGQEKHLPHEAWHVVQQKQGRVKPTMQMKSKVNINDDKSLEKEADVMGAKALQKKSFVPQGSLVAAARSNSGASVQRFKTVDADEYEAESDNDREHFFKTQSKEPELVKKKGKNYRIGHKITRSNEKQQLNVAEDDTMAINNTTAEPKEFYASADVYKKAKSKLEAGNSLIRLLKGNGLRLNIGDKIVYKITPVPAVEEVDGQASEFADFVSHICIEFASGILGVAGQNRHEAVFQSPGSQKQTTANITSQSLTGDDKIGNLAKGLVDATDETTPEELRESMHSETTAELPGIAYGKKLRKGALKKQEEKIGINSHAKPDVGEAFATFTLKGHNTKNIEYSKVKKEFEKTNHIWGYHFAGVVAKSINGKDTVTLENYNRSDDLFKQLNIILERLITGNSKKVNDKLSEISPKPSDTRVETRQKLVKTLEIVRNKTTEEAQKEYFQIASTYKPEEAWYFAMQGPRAGQSFHEQQVAGDSFVNPITLRVRPVNEEKMQQRYLAAAGIRNCPDLPPVLDNAQEFKSNYAVQSRYLQQITDAPDKKIKPVGKSGFSRYVAYLAEGSAAAAVRLAEEVGVRFSGNPMQAVTSAAGYQQKITAAINLVERCHSAVEDKINGLWITQVEEKLGMTEASFHVFSIWEYLGKLNRHYNKK